jgi:hypothetical protein
MSLTKQNIFKISCSIALRCGYDKQSGRQCIEAKSAKEIKILEIMPQKIVVMSTKVQHKQHDDFS